MKLDAQVMTYHAEALAFLGNSLLAPMSQTGAVGLDPLFWDSFPSFGDSGVEAAIDSCRAFAAAAQEGLMRGDDPVRAASVEYTHLFVGPPHPAAAPWETMYRSGSEGTTVGFGAATLEMREELRKAGLEVSNENNQYADHIGIELLLASKLCDRASKTVGGPEEKSSLERISTYLDDHPGAWIESLREMIDQEAPGGYIANITHLACRLVKDLRDCLVAARG